VEWYTVDGAYSTDVAGNVMGNTDAISVRVGDADGDGIPEIVTSGFTYNGSKAEGQLRIWNWTGSVLDLEKSREWANLDITEPTAVTINDVNGDGKPDIITSGCTAGYGSWAPGASGKTRAELDVWSYDGNAIALEETKDWIIGEAVMAWNDGAADLNNDGITEIITIGCMENGIMCDPDLRIWTVPAALAALPYLPLAIIGVVITAVIIALAVFLLIRKRR
jgi:hypothetical protein